MKKHKYGLTGEGFTMEEATELLEGYQPPPMTKEEQKVDEKTKPSPSGDGCYRPATPRM